MLAVMAAQETGELHQLEERTLSLLHHSKIDQDFSKEKTSKYRRNKKHNLSVMKKKPMAIPSVILELQDQFFRESSIRCLSNFLLQKREEDLENYARIGYLLFDSCTTMAILLQEVVVFSRLMADENLNIRASKRVINVLTLFQCIAANEETRKKFVKSCVPNFLVPIILFDNSLEIFDNVRAVALSVFGILCQAKESYVIRWAIQSDIVHASLISIEIGNELCKVIGMHIVEAILQVDAGISYLCNSASESLLNKLMITLEHLVDLLASDQEFSPRLLFHVIRCYFLLCNHIKGLEIVMKRLPTQFIDGSFDYIVKEFPVIGMLHQQLVSSIIKETSDYTWINDFSLKDGA